VTAAETILAHVPVAVLVVFRIGGLMILGPLFSSPAVLLRVRVMLAVLIGLAAYPLLSTERLGAAGRELELWSLAPLVAMELTVGMLVGFAAGLPLVSVQVGGLMMGQQMGLGFARFYNPGIDDEADVLGQILFFMALAGFLVIGGHEAMVLGVLRSFDYIPLGQLAIDGSILDLVLGMLLAAFDLALRVSAPVLAIIFLQSVALGFMSKTVPQLNILSLGFMVRILVGISIVMFGLVVIQEVVMEGVHVGLDRLFEWIMQERAQEGA
jgi:flagellar biosynthetic protein FliR